MQLTYGQLLDAANAKRTEQWDHTAAVLALIYNVNTDRKTPKVRPEDFHPLREREPRPSNYTAARVAAEHRALAEQRPVQVIRISPDQVQG